MRVKLIYFLLFLAMSFVTFPQQKNTWKTIYSFSGNSNENTDDFTIQNDKWRITWKASKQYNDVYGGNVIIKLINSNGKEKLIANSIPNDNGKTIIRESGKYYFEILAVISKWEIEIQVPN